MEINIGIIAIIVLAIAILAILASGYVKASPNKAYIISGIKREPKVLIGRAGIKIPFLEKKDELILKQISIDIKTNGYIPTKDFIGVDIDAVAKVRVLTQRDVTVNAKGEVVAGGCEQENPHRDGQCSHEELPEHERGSDPRCSD